MTIPRSNDELYEFLRALKQALVARGFKDMGELLDGALSCSPFMSTEFLAETRMGLSKLLRAGEGRLSPRECADVEAVIERLDEGGDRARR